jgi:hypothetical protein
VEVVGHYCEAYPKVVIDAESQGTPWRRKDQGMDNHVYIIVTEMGSCEHAILGSTCQIKNLGICRAVWVDNLLCDSNLF